MKINWFSPVPPAKTDIAHYTKRILPALTAQAEIKFWSTEKECDNEFKEHADVYHYSMKDVPWAQINAGDVSIYHIGNNVNFHSSIWEVSRLHPGIVVLHDIRLHHLFAGIFRELQFDKELYCHYMTHYYGEKSREDAEIFWRHGHSAEFMAERYPLTELALENAMGVIVHQKEAFESLRQKNRWPIACLPLPYPCSELKGNVSIDINTPPYRLVVFGYIGPSRCLNSIFQALADLPQKSLFQLHIYGQLWDEHYLKKQIVDLALNNIVVIHGFVTERELDSALSSSHCAFNLRNPTMGEASGSQLRIWNHALPSIVTKHGWYAELPPDTVAFVEPHRERDGIKHLLRAFLENPEHFDKMGKAGQKFLRDYHNPEHYVANLLEFSREIISCYPVAFSYHIAEKIASEASTWLGASHSEFLRPAAQEILKLRGSQHTDREDTSRP